MSDLAVIALRKRREEIAGQVHDAEKRVTKLRTALANLDAAIAILTPDHADYVAPRRHYSRQAYFKRDELSRLVREALRDAGKPLAAGEIAASVIATKRFPDSAHLSITKMIVARLGVLAGRGDIAKTGKTRNARWAISEGFSEVSNIGQI
jgi:SRSO17 transposase